RRRAGIFYTYILHSLSLLIVTHFAYLTPTYLTGNYEFRITVFVRLSRVRVPCAFRRERQPQRLETLREWGSQKSKVKS
ncbi:MAG: hypothetical protein V7L04_11090, partial [Nostoc sp.]|uniref:hypothetical protein n=1 Tax=Nostoc sp. TaxID=1180 RepID=UPI002FF6F9EA